MNLSYKFNVSPPSMRAKVERIESAIIAELPPVDLPMQHHFAPGVYAREMRIPANTVATGAVHKTEHLSIIVGHCLLTTEGGMKEFYGHHTIVSKPGMKRSITALSDVVMTTIHAIDETDPEKAVHLLTQSTARELLGGTDNKQLANTQKRLDAL